jgi:tripartite-type tricarboxylate transporter receptor subunit TctC
MRRAALGLIALLAVAPAVHAQPATAPAGYPDRPIHLVVPFPAGSATDVISRIVAQKLGTRMGQQIVVENRPGASGNLGADYIAKSDPDGYTIGMITSSTHGVAPALGKLPYDPFKDFKPISMIGAAPYVLALYAGNPAKSVAELVALAKAKPNSLSYGSAGLASTAYLAMALFATDAGIEMTHVPYKSSAQSVIDMVTGRLDMQFATIAPVQQNIAAGQLRALATSGKVRSPALPNVPTMSESGFPDFDVTLWMAYAAPAGTPDGIVTRLNREMTAVLTDKDTAAAMQKQGFVPEPGPPEATTARITNEIGRWKALVDKTGIKLE